MIARPSILYLYATLVGIVIVVAVGITPIGPHGSGMDFWWSRIAPVRYAQRALQTAKYVYTSYNGRTCPMIEDRIQAWRTLVDAQPTDSLLRGLMADASPAGKLYLLAALFYVDSIVPPDLLAEIHQDTTSQVQIWSWNKQVLETFSLRDVVDPEAVEQWARELAGQPRVGEVPSCAS